MNIIVQEEWFSVKQCKENPLNIYIFGDNNLRIGNGGQAQIRPCQNSTGVTTKRSPSMTDEAFFNDSFTDLITIMNDLYTLYQIHTNPNCDHMTLVFPKDGLGTGLSELPKRAPFINKQLELLLNQYFNIVTRIDGTLDVVKRN